MDMKGRERIGREGMWTGEGRDGKVMCLKVEG